MTLDYDGIPEIATLYADPPWAPADTLPGPTRGAAKNYEVLSVDDIMAHPLPPLAKDCRLFLWRIASMQPEALAVVKAWGFVVKSEIVWRKLTKTGLPWFGMGRQVRMSHEVCLIATRGHPARLSNSIRSVIEAVVLAHSAKPALMHETIEALSPGPYVELFARHRRTGWHSFGDALT